MSLLNTWVQLQVLQFVYLPETNAGTCRTEIQIEAERSLLARCAQRLSRTVGLPGFGRAACRKLTEVVMAASCRVEYTDLLVAKHDEDDNNLQWGDKSKNVLWVLLVEQPTDSIPIPHQ